MCATSASTRSRDSASSCSAVRRAPRLGRWKAQRRRLERIAIDAIQPHGDEPVLLAAERSCRPPCPAPPAAERECRPGTRRASRARRAASRVSAQQAGPRQARRPITSSPAAVIDTTRRVLCASARVPRAFGGSTAVIASPAPAGVILRRPARERDDVLRHERLCVEDLPDAFQVLAIERRLELRRPSRRRSR